MGFIAWLITLSENTEVLAAVLEEKLKAFFGKKTDFCVRFIHFTLIILFNLSPLALVICNAPLAVHIIIYTIFLIYLIVFSFYPSLKRYPTFRLRVLGDGREQLTAFFVTGTATLFITAAGIILWLSGVISPWNFAVIAAVNYLSQLVIFWNGIIRVYLTSLQLGVKMRVVGIVFGMVTPINLVVLWFILKKVRRESDYETEKAWQNKARKDEQLCSTKYPIVFVHGVFFRDSRIINYWGRIPDVLIENGAEVFYGEQQSAASVAVSAEELARKIRLIAENKGCGKVNIIAHSKGGLDARYAISHLGADKYVASLTTINTPHRGCIFAEYLLNTAPDKFVKTIERIYNTAYRRLGDENPDFLAAVTDLTNSRCEQFNLDTPDMPGVLYQSVGSHAVNSKSGKFPLNLSYPIVKKYDGENDGLVAVDSARWGESFTVVHPTGKKGITHADIIDFNRVNIEDFDVREFYVQLVARLKERGL